MLLISCFCKPLKTTTINLDTGQVIDSEEPIGIPLNPDKRIPDWWQ